MSGMSKRILALLALLSAVAALPAGAILTIYSIENNFFPYFLSVISLPMLAFISVCIVFIYLILLVLAMMIMSSIFMIATVVNRTVYFSKGGVKAWRAFRIALRTLSDKKSHLLLPSGRWELLGMFFMSLIFFILLLRIAILRSMETDTRGSGLLLSYFLISGFFSVAFIDLATSWMEVLNNRLPFLALVLLATLPTFWALTPLLNVCMSFMGFRSMPSQAVLVDDAAERQIAQQVAFMSNNVMRCSISFTGRAMWYMPQGVVIWNGIGNKTLVSFGITNVPPLQLSPDQVLLLPKSSELSC